MSESGVLGDMQRCRSQAQRTLMGGVEPSRSPESWGPVPDMKWAQAVQAQRRRDWGSAEEASSRE